MGGCYNGSYRNRILVCGLDSSNARQDSWSGFCENGNELWNSIKGWDFIDS
jgi:hypothetical protein